MNEADLFDAYRNPDGHYVVDCVCGGQVYSLLPSEHSIAKAIELHQESDVHQQWREWQEAVSALQRPTRHPCPCHTSPA